ncbi:MAG TPA: hypothetical protein PKG93_04440 [Bacilli bacterium]|nr:hypothetical protein [Bacilli bacterium]HPZ23827.1 hypothetical protein [Bacilli bacterium]
MKLYLKEINHRGGISGTPFDIILAGDLTIGSIYDCELCPTIYDPHTLQPVPPSYIVKCNDGKYRKVDSSFFLTLEEMRNEKLNNLGI